MKKEYVIAKIDIDKLNEMFTKMQEYIDNVGSFATDVEKVVTQSKTYIESLRIAVDALYKYEEKYEDNIAENAVKKINGIINKDK